MLYRGKFISKNNEIKSFDKVQNFSSGITLIALVITVIVLIILAGIAISMLSGDNGILNQAARAKEQTEQQSTLEQIKLATTAAIANENRSVDEEVLEKDLTGYGFEISNKDEENNYTITKGDRTFEITNDGDISEVVTEVPTEEVSVKTKFIDEQSENKVVVIPEGFKVSSVEGEQQIDTGLVVIAPDKSEFVWIPVENVNDMYEEKEIDGETRKVGKLYKFTEDGYSQITYSSSGYREPDILTNLTKGDASETKNRGIDLLKNIAGIEGADNDVILNTWKNQLQNEFNDMIDSVEKNGGFYIGRYETSLRTGTDGTTIAQVIKGKKSVTGASVSGAWYGLYQKEKEYSEKNNLSNVVISSMIWGSQYDQIMIWLSNNGINVASGKPITTECPNGAEKNKGDNGSSVSYTGVVETDKLNNLYDLIGNAREWTLESFKDYGRVPRRRMF